MAKHSYIGVDIGKSAVKIAQFTGGRLTALAAREIPYSVRAGTREAFNTRAGKLVGELAAERKFRGKFVVTNLSAPTEIQLLNLSLPQMSKSDMRGAVGMEVKKSAGSEIAGGIFDYYVAETAPDGYQKIVAAVAGEETISEKIWMFEKAGLSIKSFLTTGLALESLLSRSGFPAAEGKTLFLHVGASVSSFNLFKEGNLVLSREVFQAGDNVTSAMTRSVRTREGEVAISRERAEKIKKEHGLMEDAPAMIDGLIPSSTLSSLIMSGTERLIKEITRLTAQLKREDGEAISRIYLSGGGGRLKGLAGIVQENTGVETSVFRAEEVMELSLPEEDEKLLRDGAFDFSVACGLALCEQPRVFLVPESIKLLQKASGLKKGAVASCFIIAAAAAAFYLSVAARSSEFSSLLEERKAQLEPLSEKLELNAALRARREAVAGKEAVYRSVSNQVSLHGVFKELSNLTPGGIRLSRLELERGTGRMVISGRLMSSDMELSVFLTDLYASPFFTDLSLASRETDDEGVVNFEIKCRLLY